MLVGSPVLSRILSTTWPFASSNTMMESGYAPIKSVAPSAAAEKTVSSERTESNVFINSELLNSPRTSPPNDLHKEYIVGAHIERPYSCEPQTVRATYDRTGFFVQCLY